MKISFTAPTDLPPLRFTTPADLHHLANITTCTFTFFSQAHIMGLGDTRRIYPMVLAIGFPIFTICIYPNLLLLAWDKGACLLNYINLKLVKEDRAFDAMEKNRTRGGDRVKLEFPWYERFIKSLSYQRPKSWNGLPAECRKKIT